MNIYNIKQIRTNTLLPLFFVDLKPSANNKDIYFIETLHYTKVKFEPPRPKKKPFHNATNANAMVIPKPIASIAPDVSNAQVPILPHNVYEKTNPITSNVLSAMATIQQTIKAVLFTKTYKREPCHRFDETKKANILMSSHTRTSLLPPPTLLLSNLHSLHPWLLTLNPNNKTRVGNSRIHHKTIFQKW